MAPGGAEGLAYKLQKPGGAASCGAGRSGDAPSAGAASPLPAVQPPTASRGDAAPAPGGLAQAPGQAVPAALQRRSLAEDAVFTQGMRPLDNRGQPVRALRTLHGKKHLAITCAMHTCFASCQAIPQCRVCAVQPRTQVHIFFCTF